MRTSHDAVVIGGGQAGLAAGYWLARSEVDFVILEKGDRPVGSWPSHYDGLRLFSPARYSSLPGLPFPGDPDRYPTRDEVVEYLARYAERFDLPVETGAEVTEISRRPEGFAVSLADGVSLEARTLVLATGAYRVPVMPRLPGQGTFQGRILHSSAYLRPEDHAGERVVVVGSRNSAVQIAHELARHPEIEASLASRREPVFLPQRILGRDLHFWTRWTGFELLPPALGGTSDRVEVIDDGRYREALRSGLLERSPMFSSFDGDALVWEDGRRERVDTVVFATGYRPGHHLLEGLEGALAEDGSVDHRGGVSRRVPGLYFVGLPSQRGFASATLRGAGRDARHVVRHLTRTLRGAPAWGWACCAN